MKTTRSYAKAHNAMQPRQVIVTLRHNDQEITRVVWSDYLAEHMQDWQNLFWRIVRVDFK